MMMIHKNNLSVSHDILAGCPVEFDTLWEEVGGCFRRCDTRLHAKRYTSSLLGNVKRKNGWQLSEHLGDGTPYAVQHLLGRSNWDADIVRDEIQRYARVHLLASGDKGAGMKDV